MTPERFEKLVREHQDTVYRQMARVCSHKEDAEDALAAALLNAFKFSSQLDNETAFVRWLVTIGSRICYRMRSNPAFESTFELIEEAYGSTDGVQKMELELMKGCVNDALRELPQALKGIYLRCEIEGEDVASAARILGLSHAAGKSRLRRAREFVRSRLENSICGV